MLWSSHETIAMGELAENYANLYTESLEIEWIRNYY